MALATNVIHLKKFDTLIANFNKRDMTLDQFNKASDILDQIQKSKQLKKDLFRVYDMHKEDAELKTVLDRCVSVVDVLIEIDEKKFKTL